MISGLPLNETVREGQTLDLVCTSVAGSPKPKLAWFLGDGTEEIRAGTNFTDSPHAQSTLRIVVTREDNAREYRSVCQLTLIRS